MDTKIKLRFDESIIETAKKFTDKNNISLSRLTEFLYKKMTTANYYTIESLPISDWVNILSEGETEYQRSATSRKAMKDDYFNNRKKWNCLLMRISDNDKKDVLSALSNKKNHDFEDGLEYYSALSAKCTCIITNDTDEMTFITPK